MTLNGWLQILIFILIVTALVKPLGWYMTRVFAGERTFLSPVLRPVERGLYALAGIREDQEQHWLTYTIAMLFFHVGGFLILYALLRLQGILPFNPQGMTAVPEDLAFNTASSFITNTNWQNYGGESTLSYLVQMLGLTHQNFLSAATGIVLAVALIRGFARASFRTIGSFWVDITRCTLYVLLPICVVRMCRNFWLETKSDVSVQEASMQPADGTARPVTAADCGHTSPAACASREPSRSRSGSPEPKPST